METAPSNKKVKFNPEIYDEYSKEELIQIIHDLKCKRSDQDATKSPPLEVSPSSSVVTEKHKNKTKREFDFTKCKYRHIALKLMYLGWDYDGFAFQDNKNNTIEKHLYDALMQVCLIKDPNTAGYQRCGRTDKGVSSFSQVISVTVRSSLKENQTDDEEISYCRALNSKLPKEIRMIAWAPVSDDFNARFSCIKRTYKYWFPKGDLDIEKMNTAAQSLVGCHDFRNLCKMDVRNGVVNFKRKIIEVNISLCNNLPIPNPSTHTMCELTIVGEAFLMHQIRAIVTVLFLVGQGKENVDIISELLNIDDCPRKPVFGLSHPLPLNLYHCEYEGINWKYEYGVLRDIKRTLQSYWTISAVRCSMLGSMLGDLPKLPQNEQDKEDPIYYPIFNDFKSKIYKPLLTRPREEALEDRISFYEKKEKWKPKVKNDTKPEQ